MVNVFKDVLIDIKKNGLKEGHHLYITFNTDSPKVKIPNWLKEKYPSKMTIIIQYEYWNFKINQNSFNISLSFNDIKADLVISFNSVISFADPYANFSLHLIPDTINKEKNRKRKTAIKKKIIKNKNNIIDFKNYKKN